ncbi:MAG: hypothetical protein JKY53_08755 [Flavobacteriales bacterium]|nr:hypothetical protein [Flavobacteriales bacterium]
MKKRNLQVGTFIAIAAIGMVACNPLNKMAKNAATVTYEVTPNPLEMHNDSVSISISGKYPEKYFHKKATATVTPTMVWEGGSKEFKAITLIGEAAEGEGTKIAVAGGSFSFNDKIPYQPGMETSVINVKVVGGFKSKTKDFTEAKIGDGTVVTPLLVQSDERPIMAADKFVRITPESYNLDIHYGLQQSSVRSGELRQDGYVGMKKFIEAGIALEGKYAFKGVSISAYASPDGELTKNDELANQRAETAAKAIARDFKTMKVEAADAEGFYNKVGKGEDWDGFKEAVKATNHADKDLILRVLEMTSDLEAREQEIKNMSATYDFLRKDVLPLQRRAMITINAEKVGYSDEEIAAMAKATPDSLNVEELLYAATLTKDMNEKLAVYQSVQKVYAADWRGHNNAGYILLLQNKVDDAKAALYQAAKASSSNPIVNNNLGICARWKGDRAGAKELYNAASGAGAEVSYNMAIINIMEGDYASATNNVAAEKTFNAALAHLLNANPDGATQIIDASEAKETADGYYLKAIAAARTKNKENFISNLKSAIEADGTFKTKAAGDAEFVSFREDADFTSLVN